MEKIKTISVWQKVLICIIAVVMFFTTLLSEFDGGFTASAASYQVQMVDSSYGYGQKSTTQISKAYTLYSSDDWTIITLNGNLAYCVEPGKKISAGAQYSEKQINLTELQKRLLGRVFLYSYTKTPSNLYSYDSYLPQYIATQLLVWEVIVGQRNDDFNYISNGYAKVSSMLDKFNDSSIGSSIKSYYNAYESAIKADKKSISFAYSNNKEDLQKAKSNAKLANADGTYTFTDTNGQLNNFDVTVTNGSVVSKSATQLKIKADSNKTASISFKQNNVNASGERSGWLVYASDGNQTIGQAKADPREYLVYLKGLSDGNVRIKKTSDDGKVADIRFQIKGNGITPQTATTDKTGNLYFKGLKAGMYTVTELPTPEQRGNYNSVLSKTVTVTAGKTVTVKFENTRKSGHISVTKYSEDGVVEGIGFELMSYALGTNGIEIPVELYDMKYTDADGYVEWNDLPYVDHFGRDLYYWVDEVDIPDRYVTPILYWGEYDENINYDDGKKEAISFKNMGDDIAFTCYNKSSRSDVLIVKKDYETGQTVPIEGTEFQIYDSDGELVILKDSDGNDVSTFTTDKSGQILLPESLVYGTYQLVETKAPKGYVLDPTPVDFAITRDGVTVTVSKKNSEQKGKITVTKTGDVFSSVEESNGTYKPVFSEGSLSGAEFNVIALQDIYYPDGTVRIEKGTVVDTIVTGEDGTGTSKDLYLGSYNVIETKAPNGYVLNSADNLVDLEYAGQEAEVSLAGISVNNSRQQAKITVSKFVESSEKFGINAADAIQYIDFGLYANEEIIAEDGTVIPKDGLIEAIGLGSDFTTSFNTDLPFGSYYVKEISTDEHYIISDEKHEFSFKYAGQDIQTVEIETDEFVNDLKKGEVKGVKVDADTEVKLAGAVIGLFSVDETSFTKENAIETTESDNLGTFSFNEIPYGVYQIKEIAAPEGYILTDEVFPVTIDENGKVIEITIKNEKIKGNVRVEKYDLFNPDAALSGAIFTVYKDYGQDGEYNGIDSEYGVLTEDEIGKYELTGIEYGDYLLKETKEPEGYVIDEKYYSFKIRKDGETITIVNDESKDKFFNKPVSGDVKGLKINSDDKTALEGALIGLFANGESEFTEKNALKTDRSAKDGSFEFNEILYGKYVVAEIAAPEGYILTDKTYDVNISKDGDLIEITMENKPIKGNVYVAKYGDGNPSPVLKDAEFTIYADKNGDGEYNADKDELVGKLAETSIGIHEYRDLLYGKYLLKETKAPKGYVIDNNYYPFSITKDGETITISNDNSDRFINKNVKGNIEGIKLGKELKPLSDALIGLFENDESVFTKENAIATVKTLKDGKFAFKDVLYGKYIVAEIEAPTGYILTDETFPVIISENGQTINIEIENMKINGNIEGIKVGEENEPLSGAVIGLFANGESGFVKENALRTATTEKDGKFSFKEVEFGKYIVAEIAAPTGYVLTDKTFPVDINKNGETINVEISNIKIRGNIEGIKVGEKNEPLSGAVIGLFKGNETSFTEEHAISTVTTSDNGKFAFNNIEYGKYIVAEIEAPTGYVLTNERFPVMIDENGKRISITISNSEVYGNIEGLKINEIQEPLSDAVIGLFYDGETSFTAKTAIKTITTDDNGNFAFEHIKYGKYIVAEIEAPEGYVLTDEVFPIAIDENDKIIEITVKNEKIKGNVHIEKYDSLNDEKLSGAEFTVYIDSNGNGIYDEDESIYGTLTEIENGLYSLKDIPYGKYILKETKAPEGYIIDENYYSFSILYNGETTVITNNESADRFVNVKETTTVTTTTTTTTTTVTTATVPAVKTGDSRGKVVSIASVVGIISLAGIALSYRRKRKNRKC